MIKPQKFDPEYDKIETQLYIVFTYYCCFGDRENYTLLKIQNFRRMLSDAQLIQNEEDNTYFDIIHAQSKKKGGIDFKLFIEQLPIIIKSYNSNVNLKESVRRTISTNFHTLYEYILENTQFGEDIKFINKSSFSEPMFKVLKSIAPTIKKIYDHYFDPKNMKKIRQNEQIFKQLSLFTKQFELTPQLLTKTCSFLVFTFLMNQKSESAYLQWFKTDKSKNIFESFTFFHFIQYLVITSQIANKKIYGLQISDYRKISNLLQRMEISRGFTSLCKKVKINQHLIQSEEVSKKYEHQPSITISPTKNIKSSPYRKIQENMIESPDRPLERIVIKNYNELKQKFIELCAYGETLVCSKLTHRKALSLLKEIPLTQNELQVVISSVSNGSLDFQQFIEVIEKISLTKNIQLSQIVKLLLSLDLDDEERDNKVPPSFAQSKYNICEAMIQNVENFLEQIFQLGAQPDKTQHQLSFLSIDDYLKIMYDFQVTPHLITKQGIINTFQKSLRKGIDFMTYGEFKQSFLIMLAYTSIKPQYYQKQLEMDELLIIILQTMNSSRGVNRIFRRLDSRYPKEDYLNKFRTLFKPSYPASKRKQLEHQKALRQLLR